MTMNTGVLALSLAVVCAATALMCERLFAADAVEETPKEIIADQIRRQGYACGNPLSAERDLDRSKPDEAAWVLKCDNATYRVRLIPDMAAVVERVD